MNFEKYIYHKICNYEMYIAYVCNVFRKTSTWRCVLEERRHYVISAMPLYYLFKKYLF